MWIILNDAMLSIVENRDDKTEFVVRARQRIDLERVFPAYAKNIIESDTSDYRFRLFLDRDVVKENIAHEMDRIDYDNFKNSVREIDRRQVYTKIWTVLFDWQERLFPRETSWWLNYRTVNNRGKKSKKPKNVVRHNEL